MKILSYLIIVLLFIACDNRDSKTKDAAEPEGVNEEVQGFESIPQELVIKIYNEANLLDYIFHELPFSMSQDEQPSIRANVSYISREAQSHIPEGCKPMARQFYASDGDIFLEADVYFDENCQFYVFYVDNEARYANKMSEDGIRFFNTMIDQALKAAGSEQ